MPQIRLALIGLSAGAKTSWAEQGHLPYLLSARGRSHYELAGLLNSNVGAGEAAKKHFQLPPAVKVYGDAAALAADPDIDLVVCCTRVDVHYQTLESVARAGKAIYVEWPVAENHARAVSLWNSSSSSRANAANNSMVGLQGRLSPVVRKLKQVLRQGQIGRVLSSDVRAFNNVFARDALPAGLSYFAERAVGGNLITILYAHTVDLVHEVLGEFEDGTVQSRMQVQRPVLKAITTAATGAREAGSEDFETITSDVPDLLVIHGALAAGKQDIAAGATLSATFRSGQPFKGAPAFVWTINGEKGELRVTSSAGPYLQSYSYTEPVTIELHVYETDEVVTVDWDWDEWQKELPARGRLVADVYERYADWNKKGSAVVKDGGNYSIPEERIWPRIPDAVVRHREIEALFERIISLESSGDQIERLPNIRDEQGRTLVMVFCAREIVRDYKPALAWRESAWPCEYALVRETPKTAAEVAFFGRLLTVTPVNRVLQLLESIHLMDSSIKYAIQTPY